MCVWGVRVCVFVCTRVRGVLVFRERGILKGKRRSMKVKWSKKKQVVSTQGSLSRGGRKSRKTFSHSPVLNLGDVTNTVLSRGLPTRLLGSTGERRVDLSSEGPFLSSCCDLRSGPQPLRVSL